MINQLRVTSLVLALQIFLLASACASERSPERIQAIAKAAEALRPRLVQLRRDFHQHPELSNEEVRTSAVVAEQLRKFGLEDIRTNVAKHGVVAVLKGGHSGPVVA